MLNKSTTLATSTSVGTDIYPHVLILRPQAAWYSTNCASLEWRLCRRISTLMFTCEWAWLPRSPICLILGFWGSKVHKNGRFPALNATSFILGGEIGNHTNNKCTQKKQKTNSNRYIQTLHIGIPCLSACVDSKYSSLQFVIAQCSWPLFNCILWETVCKQE